LYVLKSQAFQYARKLIDFGRLAKILINRKRTRRERVL